MIGIELIEIEGKEWKGMEEKGKTASFNDAVFLLLL